MKVKVKSEKVGLMLSAQLCPTLCDPMDCSLPGSSIRGIFHARILEWVALFFSKVGCTVALMYKIPVGFLSVL